MTVHNCGSLTLEDALNMISRGQNLRDEGNDMIEVGKGILSKLHADGEIPTLVSTPEMQVVLQTRKTWSYGNSVAQAKRMEELDGSATQKESSSWVVRKPSRYAINDF